METKHPPKFVEVETKTMNGSQVSREVIQVDQIARLQRVGKFARITLKGGDKLDLNGTYEQVAGFIGVEVSAEPIQQLPSAHQHPALQLQAENAAYQTPQQKALADALPKGPPKDPREAAQVQHNAAGQTASAAQMAAENPSVGQATPENSGALSAKPAEEQPIGGRPASEAEKQGHGKRK